MLRTLQCFEALSGYPSFSSAAESLGMTHGAISHQIRALEAWLGRPVFSRHPGGIRLTEDGERLQQACTRALSLLDEECARIRRLPVERTVAVGCSATFLGQWLLPRIERFTRQSAHPSLVFQTCDQVGHLLTGSVDVVIASECAPLPEGIECFRLAADVIGPVCSPTWSRLPKAPSEMRGLPLLHAASRVTAWSEWTTAVGAEIGDNPLPGRRFESLSLTLEAARSRLGFAISPEFLVRQDIEAGRLVAPLGFAKVQRATCVYSRRLQRSQTDVTSFISWLLSEAKGGMATPSPSPP